MKENEIKQKPKFNRRMTMTIEILVSLVTTLTIIMTKLTK